MTARRTSQLLVLLAALFGVLAFGCQCASQKRAAEEPTEFPKLSEP